MCGGREVRQQESVAGGDLAHEDGVVVEHNLQEREPRVSSKLSATAVVN